MNSALIDSNDKVRLGSQKSSRVESGDQGSRVSDLEWRLFGKNVHLRALVQHRLARIRTTVHNGQ